jgi:putative Se/S carrier protein
MDGLISFFASHYAIRAETVLKRSGLPSRLVPGPKDLSPNCGVALRFDYVQRENVLAVLTAKKVQIEGVHFYRPRTDEWKHGDNNTFGNSH